MTSINTNSLSSFVLSLQVDATQDLANLSKAKVTGASSTTSSSTATTSESLHAYLQSLQKNTPPMEPTRTAEEKEQEKAKTLERNNTYAVELSNIKTINNFDVVPRAASYDLKSILTKAKITTVSNDPTNSSSTDSSTSSETDSGSGGEDE